MKRVNCFSMLAAALALTLGATSCIKNELENGNEAEGQKTYMTVSFAFPKAPQSYAESLYDDNATEEEAAVKTVDVYIYTSGGIFVSHTSLDVDTDFDGPDDGQNKDHLYTAKTKIATTTGGKLVYVGINLPSTIATSLANKPVSELKTVAQTFTRAQLTTPDDGIPMFSTADTAPASFVPEDDVDADDHNNITVNVKRMVAKVTVERSTSLDVDAVPGTLSDYSFVVNNFNLKSFMEQGAAPDFEDPNWDTGSYVSTDFVDANPATDYIAIVTAGGDATDLEAHYASENTSREKNKGELTYVTVRAKFIPTNVTVYKNDSDPSEDFKTVTSASLNITTPQIFWSVTPSVALGTRFFYTEAIADDYADAKGGEVVEYEDGYCYWNIFLNKNGVGAGAEWDVVRNDYYRCTITRIAGIGNWTEAIEDDDKDTPPNTDTNITTSINVVHWNMVTSEYVLEQ
jgi:hypothetical protein